MPVIHLLPRTLMVLVILAIARICRPIGIKKAVHVMHRDISRCVENPVNKSVILLAIIIFATERQLDPVFYRRAKTFEFQGRMLIQANFDLAVLLH